MSTPTPLYIALLLVVPAVQLPLASFFGLDLAFIPPLAISSVQFFAASFMLYYIKKPIIAAVCNLAGTDELSTMSAQWTADNFQFGWTLLGYIGILLSKKVDPWTENQRGGTISGLVVGAVFVLVAINICESVCTAAPCQ